MLRFLQALAVSLALLLCGPVLPAEAQDAAPAPAMLEGIEAAGSDGATIDMATAEVIRAALQDEILLLGRIVEAQSRLGEVNTMLLAAGRDPLTIPGHLCPSSPMAPHCDALPATFGSPAP